MKRALNNKRPLIAEQTHASHSYKKYFSSTSFFISPCYQDYGIVVIIQREPEQKVESQVLNQNFGTRHFLNKNFHRASDFEKLQVRCWRKICVRKITFWVVLHYKNAKIWILVLFERHESSIFFENWDFVSKFYNMSDFESFISLGVRFRIKIFSTCQNLRQVFYNASVVE